MATQALSYLGRQVCPHITEIRPSELHKTFLPSAWEHGVRGQTDLVVFCDELLGLTRVISEPMLSIF